jgi:hypothetical protein
MAICALCKENKELKDSHIFPAFVFRWLKDTSVTGHMRDPRHGNRRVQDGPKVPLLCSQCEQILSKDESEFNLKIFQVFTTKFLDLAGRITSDGYLRYGEWLNRFAISLAWRSFVSHFYTEYPNGASASTIQRVNVILERWRKYLVNESQDYGKTVSYLLFLRDIHAGEGTLPTEISPKITHYLMRSVDGALIFDGESFLDMTKLGPVMFLTAMYPKQIIGYPNSSIARTGKIKIEQNWTNARLNSYLLVSRPNEFDKLRGKTERQQAQVDEALKKNLHRVDTTMTMSVLKADLERN